MIAPVMAEVTITPDQFDFTFNGNTKTLTFKVCHDEGKTLKIPLVTEVTNDDVENLNYVEITSPLTVTANKCKNVNVKVTEVNNAYKSSRIRVALKYHNTTVVLPEDTYSNIEMVQERTNLSIVEIQEMNETEKNENQVQEETSLQRFFRVNRTLLILASIVIVIIVIYFAYRQFKSEQSEASNPWDGY